MTSEVLLTPNLDLGGVTPNPNFVVSAGTSGLAIDQSGNFVLRYARNFGFTSLPSVLVNLSPSGEVIGERLLDSGAFLALEDGDLVFDSSNRLVVAGDDLARFEFV